jgi:chemotaxis protein histidine kinase CheA
MAVDPYTVRLARVRERFVSAIESRIEDTYADLPKLSGEGRDVTDTLGETYRRIHGIVGIGPTVGFPATAKAAKTVENVLLGPYRDTRGLVSNEVDALKRALHVLREAARREIQITYSTWR